MNKRENKVLEYKIAEKIKNETTRRLKEKDIDVMGAKIGIKKGRICLKLIIEN